MEAPPTHFSCFTLATFKKIGEQFILNTVKDFQPNEVLENSIGVLRIGNSECTAWVIAVPKQITIGKEQILCIVCTAGHSLINPFTHPSKEKVSFTFAQKNQEIDIDFDLNRAYKAFPIYCPSDVEDTDSEIDPISGNTFSLSHDISLFAIIKKIAKRDTVNCLEINVQSLCFEENNDIEINVLGYPLELEHIVEALIVPDNDRLGLTTSQIEEEFTGLRSLVISPGTHIKKSTEDTLIAVTNPAAPRLSGCPLILRNQVIGLLVGSVPLVAHIHSANIAVLAQYNIGKALQYIKANHLEDEFPPKVFHWQELENQKKSSNH